MPLSDSKECQTSSEPGRWASRRLRKLLPFPRPIGLFFIVTSPLANFGSAWLRDLTAVIVRRARSLDDAANVPFDLFAGADPCHVRAQVQSSDDKVLSFATKGHSKVDTQVQATAGGLVAEESLPTANIAFQTKISSSCDI